MCTENHGATVGTPSAPLITAVERGAIAANMDSHQPPPENLAGAEGGQNPKLTGPLITSFSIRIFILSCCCCMLALFQVLVCSNVSYLVSYHICGTTALQSDSQPVACYYYRSVMIAYFRR